MHRKQYVVWPILGLVFNLLLLGCGGESSTSKKISRLRTFAKLYGYVKYFHPSDQAAGIDWNRFALLGAAEIGQVKDDGAFEVMLKDLFYPIAPSMELFSDIAQPEKDPASGLRDSGESSLVAWQHEGVNLGSPSIYNSIRINRENRIPYGARTGIISQGLPSAELGGKNFRFSARIKSAVEGLGNEGRMWFRVNLANQGIGFFDNMGDRPIRAHEWDRYHISGRIDEGAESITMGFILGGSGSLWIDDVGLEVESDNGGWISPDLKNPGFEAKGEGDSPADWYASGPRGSGYSYRVVEEPGMIDGACLLIEKKPRIFNRRLFEKCPGPDEYIEKEIGSGLRCRIPLALNSFQESTGSERPDHPVDTLSARLDLIELYSLTAEDEILRLADVIIAWNVFQHFFPYFDVVDVDWDLVLTESLASALQARSERDFYLTLCRMVERLEDGHGNVFHSVVTQESGFPFRVDWIDSRVVVTASQDPEHFRPGDVIRSVDGVAAANLLHKAEEFISGSLQWKRVKALNRFAYGPGAGTASFVIDRNGEEIKFEVKRGFKGMVAEFQRSPLEEIKPGIFYVNLDVMAWPQIEERIQDLAAAAGVIFDLRGYPNGNHQVISHLLSEPDTSEEWMQVPRIIYPDRENIMEWRKVGWRLPVLEPRIAGKTVFITDGRAISYAESFLSFIEHYRLAEIVGGPTAGANGNVNVIELPGDFRISWTGMRVVKHDGSQHHTIGIQPTIPQSRTLEGVRAGRDELLDRALEYIESGKDKN